MVQKVSRDVCTSDRKEERVSDYACACAYLCGQVRDGLDLPFEGAGDFDQINWIVWKQQLTRLEELGFNGPEMRAKAHYQDRRVADASFTRAYRLECTGPNTM